MISHKKLPSDWTKVVPIKGTKQFTTCFIMRSTQQELYWQAGAFWQVGSFDTVYYFKKTKKQQQQGANNKLVKSEMFSAWRELSALLLEYGLISNNTGYTNKMFLSSLCFYWPGRWLSAACTIGNSLLHIFFLHVVIFWFLILIFLSSLEAPNNIQVVVLSFPFCSQKEINFTDFSSNPEIIARIY